MWQCTGEALRSFPAAKARGEAPTTVTPRQYKPLTVPVPPPPPDAPTGGDLAAALAQVVVTARMTPRRLL